MKKKVVQICSLVGLLIGLMVSAQAQIGTEYRAHIPFDFNVGSKTFPAGDYVIGLTDKTSGQSILTIRDLKSGEAKIFQTIPKTAEGLSEVSRLVFNCYEDRYFLAEMTTPTLSAGFQKAKKQTCQNAETQAANCQYEKVRCENGLYLLYRTEHKFRPTFF